MSRLQEAIRSQIKFHEDNAAKQECLHLDIESCSKWLFRAVLLCASVHVLETLIGTHHFYFVGLLVCVGGPVLIAALHGFASQIESARLRERSASMVKILTQHEEALKRFENPSDPHSAEHVWGLTSEALAVASAMMDETASWSLLYRDTDIHAG